MFLAGTEHAQLSVVHQYLDKQENSSLKSVFDKFAEIPSVDEPVSKLEPFIKIDRLHAALCELGIHMERDNTDELALMDLDDNGGLDFEEFKRAVHQQQTTQLEQWACMLPLAGMLARSLPLSDGKGDQPLREFSRLTDDGINAAVNVFSEGLQLLLIKARASLRQSFDSIDKKASEAAKVLAGGVSAISKFKTFKMSTGNVNQYHQGLSSRIGM
jgi:hypothetical protein